MSWSITPSNVGEISCCLDKYRHRPHCSKVKDCQGSWAGHWYYCRLVSDTCSICQILNVAYSVVNNWALSSEDGKKCRHIAWHCCHWVLLKRDFYGSNSVERGLCVSTASSLDDNIICECSLTTCKNALNCEGKHPNRLLDYRDLNLDVKSSMVSDELD